MTCNKSTRKPHDTWLYSCNDTIINNEMTRSVSTAQEIWMTYWYSFIIIGERNRDGLLISGQHFISWIWESFLTITRRTKQENFYLVIELGMLGEEKHRLHCACSICLFASPHRRPLDDHFRCVVDRISHSWPKPSWVVRSGWGPAYRSHRLPQMLYRILQVYCKGCRRLPLLFLKDT